MPALTQGESLLVGDSVVGTITSVGYGYRVGANLAMAFVAPEHAEIGTHMEVSMLGQRFGATVTEPCLYDPQHCAPAPEVTREVQRTCSANDRPTFGGGSRSASPWWVLLPTSVGAFEINMDGANVRAALGVSTVQDLGQGERRVVAFNNHHFCVAQGWLHLLGTAPTAEAPLFKRNTPTALAKKYVGRRRATRV